MALRSRKAAGVSERLIARRPRPARTTWPTARIAGFCRTWNVDRLARFDATLAGRFNSTNQIGLLAMFDPTARWTLLDHARMRDELSEIVGHRVDLLTSEGVESARNPLRLRLILESAKVVYAL